MLTELGNKQTESSPRRSKLVKTSAFIVKEAEQKKKYDLGPYQSEMLLSVTACPEEEEQKRSISLGKELSAIYEENGERTSSDSVNPLAIRETKADFFTFNSTVLTNNSNRDSERSASSNGSLFLDMRQNGGGGQLERQITFREFCTLVKQTPGVKVLSTGGDSGRSS